MYLSVVSSDDWYPGTAVSATDPGLADHPELTIVSIWYKYTHSHITGDSSSDPTIPSSDSGFADYTELADVSNGGCDCSSDSSVYRASYPTFPAFYTSVADDSVFAFLPIG
jgi:hypothetical protein